MSADIQAMVDQIGKMTVMEVCELVKLIEETFGVSAQQAVAVAAAPDAGGAAVAEEQTEFDVVMTSFGSNKIAVIKVVRELLGLALKDAKDLVQGAPATIKEAVAKDEADKIKEQLEEAGATVEIK